MSCQEMEIDTKVWGKELLIKQFLWLSMKVDCGKMVSDPLRLDRPFQESKGEGATVGNKQGIKFVGIFVEFSSIFCFDKQIL